LDWYPRNPNHYDRSTIGFSLAEHGAYCRLIDYYMQTEEALPDDDVALAQILRCNVDDWLAVAEKVRGKFQVLEDGKLHQKRCDEELQKQHKLAGVSRENGKKGGRPKGSKDKKKGRAKPRENPTGTQAGAQKKPQTDRQTESKKEEALASSKDPDAKRRCGTRLPADWYPTQHDIAYARDRDFGDPQIADMAENFLVYFSLGAGRNKTHMDWSRAWQTWVRRETPRAGYTARGPVRDPILTALDNIGESYAQQQRPDEDLFH